VIIVPRRLSYSEASGYQKKWGSRENKEKEIRVRNRCTAWSRSRVVLSVSRIYGSFTFCAVLRAKKREERFHSHEPTERNAISVSSTKLQPLVSSKLW